MVTALIFAGGTGRRMNSKSKPKQFLELHGKPIIIHTLEYFEESDVVDNIVIVCIADWIDYLKEMLKRYGIDKVKWIVEGGKTGQESIKKGLQGILKDVDLNETIVMIHDGVRPLITSQLLIDCVESVKKYGSAITVSPVKENVVFLDDNNIIHNSSKKNKTKIAQAPQCFYLKDIISAHERALEENKNDFIDSASMMTYYGYSLHPVKGPDENIKITTASDFYIFRAIFEARENSQIFGI